MKLSRAIAYLENVKGHREAVPMRRYAGSTGRCAQGRFLESFHAPLCIEIGPVGNFEVHEMAGSVEATMGCWSGGGGIEGISSLEIFT